jgi:hypothetical protein
MGLQGWVAGAILVDLVLLALLSCVIFRLRQRKVAAGHVIADNSFSLAKEIQQLQGDLEKNLSEKRTLTQSILVRLEHRLASAEELSRHLEGLLAQAEKLNPGGNWQDNPAEDTRRAAVSALGAKGISAPEIASILQLPLGEVALMLKLQKDCGTVG